MEKIADKILIIPKKIWMFGLAISMILTIISFGFSAYIDKIEVGDIIDWYHTLLNFCPTIIDLTEFKGRWIFIIFDLIFILLIFNKRTLFVICHQTLAYDLAKIDKSFKSKYFLNENILKQTDGIHPNLIDRGVIENIDKLAIEAQKSKRQITYYGIAYTPLIFRMGFKVGDQNNVKLLHKKRNNSAVFEEWNNQKTEIRITSKEETPLRWSDEMIVAISTSLEIKKEHLTLLLPEKKHVVYFCANYMGFDSILSYVDAESLRENILGYVRELVKKYKIKKIDMVISSSVAFTFFLAQAYSAQHDPEIVVYHYEHGKYTWGINMNREGDKAFIKQ